MSTPKAQRANGFTLMEMLIALAVLSIGLLGLAGLQAQALQNNHTAYLRSQATLLTYEVIDSMRANRLAAASGAYDIALEVDPSGTTIAALDLIAWKGALAATLPGGDGSIAVTTVGLRYSAVVRVEWQERTADIDKPTETIGFSWSTEL